MSISLRRSTAFVATFVGMLLALRGDGNAAEPQSLAGPLPPPARLALSLDRGIAIDRQFRTIPPEPVMRISRDDVRLIRSMGFQFVKLLVNPEPLMEGDRLSRAARSYLQELVACVADEGMPVVVCIHPEWKFKEVVLSDEKAFARLVAFLEDTGRFLAARWGPKQLALQLMTEPGGNALDWNGLQPRLWQAARRAMPQHTLILAGDQVGKIEGLVRTRPVHDENVLYSFTFYDAFPLVLQGAEWIEPRWWSHLGGVPYPASPETIRERMPAILEKIPASPADWRPAVAGMLKEYGDARWNRGKIAERVGKLQEWNRSHGGGLKIWCAEFGCYQRTIEPAVRCRYLQDLREEFEKHGIGWAYWSYNETFTAMTLDRQPFGPAKAQTPDKQLLEALLGRGRPVGPASAKD
jgi:hypothetical protein